MAGNACNVREYSSTLYVGMAPKQNGHPYISSDELKSHRDKSYCRLTCWYLVFYDYIPTSSGRSKIVIKVKNRQVAKLAKSLYYYYYYYFHKKSFFCLVNYHNDFSNIPVAFIAKWWSIIITEMISLGTMKEDNLKDSSDLISNVMPFS